jgi:hypothetical protein
MENLLSFTKYLVTRLHNEGGLSDRNAACIVGISLGVLISILSAGVFFLVFVRGLCVCRQRTTDETTAVNANVMSERTGRDSTVGEENTEVFYSSSSESDDEVMRQHDTLQSRSSR